MASSVESYEKYRDFLSELSLLFETVNISSDSKKVLARRIYFETRLQTILTKCCSEENPMVIEEFIDHFIDYGHKLEEIWSLLKMIVQVIKNSITFTRVEKIFALEFIGSVLINWETFEYFAFGLQCWKEAMNLRYFSQDGELLPKISDEYVPSAASSVVFGSAVEYMTMEELDLLQEDFDRNFVLFNRDFRISFKIRIQALLQIRRILYQTKHRKHLCWFNLQSLFNFSEFIKVHMLMQNQGSRMEINTYLVILEQLNAFEPSHLSRESLDVFMDALNMLAKHFQKKLREPPSSPEREDMFYSNFLVPAKFIAGISQIFPNVLTFSSLFNGCFIEVVHRYILLLDSISPRITDKEKRKKLKESYSIFLRNSPERTTTVLHVAVGRNQQLPAVFIKKIIQLILELGADPNAIDEKGQTPLHILAKQLFVIQEEYVSVFQTLVDSGIHLDDAADNGDTVLSILKESSKPFHPYLENLVKTVLPLKCYAARVIRRHGIDGDRLPSSLQGFVARHSAKGITNIIKVIICFSI
jgi:hypothetical protein